MITVITDTAKRKAIEIVEGAGFTVHAYTAYAGQQDEELANALRLLGRNGFVIQDNQGRLVGGLIRQRSDGPLSATEVRG